MKNLSRVYNSTEQAVYSLRALYDSFGFKKYRMSKFEQYDLYAQNKSYLLSENVITFTDTDGKLMALKPDVTLSIIKNGKDKKGLEKVYYNENVYRVSKGTNSFKEFMQVGLECFGDIDKYAIFEVVYLAIKSLESISSEYILDISNLDVIKGILEYANLSKSVEESVISFLSEKNAHGIVAVCEKENLSQETTALLLKLITLYGQPKKVIGELKALNLSTIEKPLNELEGLVLQLEKMGLIKNVRIDFSVVSDMNYYNGIVFKGFVSGIPSSIVSGGQYDNLMNKMNRRDGAIGFAVYLDDLTKLTNEDSEFDVDVVILYDEQVESSKLIAASEKYTQKGESVLTAKNIPENLRFKRKVVLKGGKTK